MSSKTRIDVIIFIFRGGWLSGSPQQFQKHYQYLAFRGMVVMTAEYRVLKRHGVKAVSCFCNAKSAICWIRKNPERISSVLKNTGLEPVQTLYEAPNANAFTERWIRSLHKECLNHLIIFGLDRLQYVPDKYKDFFNQHRPHQDIGNCIPEQFSQQTGGKAQNVDSNSVYPGDIRCHEFLGGLLKSHVRRAA